MKLIPQEPHGDGGAPVCRLIITGNLSYYICQLSPLVFGIGATTEEAEANMIKNRDLFEQSLTKHSP